ncbi:MAG: hypothetical protein K6E35_01500 [Bacteroidales bacterium]|nr:hypothetical protein [Bacteroidales bacterium]
MVNRIDIHKLTLEELSGVIALYPWYGGARMELCRRMSEAGALSDIQIAETALLLTDRQVLAKLLRAGRTVDCSDKDARRLADAFISAKKTPKVVRRVHVAGGDYFSPDQYAGAKVDEDNIFTRFATKSGEDGNTEYPAATEEAEANFCTETLARIYLEQGYLQEATDIYSRLSLRYPEKSVYFAALIDEINKKDN